MPLYHVMDTSGFHSRETEPALPLAGIVGEADICVFVLTRLCRYKMNVFNFADLLKSHLNFQNHLCSAQLALQIDRAEHSHTNCESCRCAPALAGHGKTSLSSWRPNNQVSLVVASKYMIVT